MTHKFDFPQLVTNKIDKLRQEYDCKKCSSCLYQDCPLAACFRLKWFLEKGAERQAERQAEDKKWQEDLRRSTMPDGGAPTLSDFDGDGVTWGNA